MGKRYILFLILFFSLLAGSIQELSAQSFLSSLFKHPNKGTFYRQKKGASQKRYNCYDLPAYNKPKAFKRHKSKFKKNPKDQQENPVVKRTPKPGEPPQKRISSTTPPPKPGSGPPKKGSPTDTSKPTTGTPSPEPLAKADPVVPKPKETPSEVKRDVIPLTREQLRKMTIDERRDTLEKITPTIILPPIQFISAQDEFSVVNMDSFMQAMEYAQQGKVVLVEGHTDDLGSESYNMTLSIKRAEKIRQLLLSGDVGDELISVIGYGESMPVVPNTSDENRSINRRIEFKIFSLPEN